MSVGLMVNVLCTRNNQKKEDKMGNFNSLSTRCADDSKVRQGYISSSILTLLSLFNKKDSLIDQQQVLCLVKVGAAIFFDLHPYIVAPISATDI